MRSIARPTCCSAACPDRFLLPCRRRVIDVLIQTHNEELNLPHTLRSLEGWTGRVFVVDSGSTDRTVELAEAWGATAVHHDWEGYARQKNWALATLPFESDWILIVDADEAVGDRLRDKLVEIAGRPLDETGAEPVGYELNRVFIFSGTEIWHCGYYPSWNLRFFRRGMARYEERRVHEYMICDGPTARLAKQDLLLHNDRRGLEHFYAKHNRYSTLEAREMYDNPEPWPGLGVFRRDTARRRRFIKSRVLPRVPAPWLFRFAYMYVLRLGFLDGRAGWHLSNFISAYELSIHLKYKEVARGWRYEAASALALPEGKPLAGDATDAVTKADRPPPERPKLAAYVVRAGADEDEVRQAAADAGRLGGTVEVVDAAGDVPAAMGGANGWTFVLRGDERLSATLIRDVGAIVRRPGAGGPTAYAAKVQTVVAGRRIRFGGFGPRRCVRLYRGEAIVHDDAGRLWAETRGPTGKLGGLVVRPIRRPVDELIDARLAAAEATGGAFAASPLRPMARYLRRYVLLGGFLDGQAGALLCGMAYSGEYMAQLLATERARRPTADR